MHRVGAGLVGRAERDSEVMSDAHPKADRALSDAFLLAYTMPSPWRVLFWERIESVAAQQKAEALSADKCKEDAWQEELRRCDEVIERLRSERLGDARRNATALADAIGKWPGDEGDEHVREAMDGASDKEETE